MKTIEIKNFRTKHIVLTEPMTEKELKENIRKNGRISAKVLLDFTEIVNYDGEWFNDEVSEKITNSVAGLSDINFSIVGRTTKNDAIVKIDAEVNFDYL